MSRFTYMTKLFVVLRKATVSFVSLVNEQYTDSIMHGATTKITQTSIQGVTGGMDQTSGECSLGQTIPI